MNLVQMFVFCKKKTAQKLIKMNLDDMLKVVPNPGCHKGCNQQKRDEFTENGLCTEVVSVIDQLPIRYMGYRA